MNHIEQAVAPLKAECVSRTVANTRNFLTKFANNLVGSDLNAIRPNNNMSRANYRMAQERSHLAEQVCEYERNAYRRIHDPKIATGIDQEGIDRLVEDAAKDAAISFDAYVYKLTQKVGSCDSASVVGDLWTGSILTVTKGDVVENWSTKIIFNVSCHGKVFNQFPTRLKK